jgi:hypothetical protein
VIIFVCGVLIALYHVIVVLDMVRRGANRLFAVLLAPLGCDAAVIHYHARPHLWTLLFLAASGLLIANDRARPNAGSSAKQRVWTGVATGSSSRSERRKARCKPVSGMPKDPNRHLPADVTPMGASLVRRVMERMESF